MASEFSGDPSVLGRALIINGSPFTVVGVAPAELAVSRDLVRVDVWLPAAFEQSVRPVTLDRSSAAPVATP